MLTSSREYSLQVGNIHFKGGIFTCSKSRESLLGCREFAPRGGGRSVDGGKLIPWSCHIKNITSHTIWSCHIRNITSDTHGPATFKIFYLALRVLPYLECQITPDITISNSEHYFKEIKTGFPPQTPRLSRSCAPEKE